MAKTLSLKPVEKALKEILRNLKKLDKHKDLTAKQRKMLAKDINNVEKLIRSIPPNCYLHNPPYDFRY